MEPNGSENFKMLLLLQMAAKSFETCPEFSSPCSSQNYVADVWNFVFPSFNDLFSIFFITIVAYGEIKNLNYLVNERS